VQQQQKERELFDSIEDEGNASEVDAIVAISSPCQREGEVTSGSDGGKDCGPAVLGDDSSPGDSEPPWLRKKVFRKGMLDQAVAAGDDAVVRMLRQAVSAADAAAQGRSTRSTKAYCEMADAIRLERQMDSNAKRARLREDRDEAIRATDSKRLLATAEKEAQEAKQKAIAVAAASVKAKKQSDLASAAAKRRNNWLQHISFRPNMLLP